jgi:hypothetical protein
MAKTLQEKAVAKAARRQCRRGKGTLKDQQVGPRVRVRYELAFMLLCAFFCREKMKPQDPCEYDKFVSRYVESLYAEGDSFSRATDTLAGLQYYYPAAIGKLKHSWKLCQVWKHVEPPNRVRPFSPLMVLGLAGAAVSLQLFDMAAIFLVGFDRFMRTGELFSMGIASISFLRGKAVIRLIDTKTSKRKASDECVVVESMFAIKVLKKACMLRRMGQTVLARSPAQARALFKKLLQLFDLSATDYNLYSLRRGGATAYFFKTGSMEKTLATGRWESTSTARIYIQDAAAQLGELSLTNQQLVNLSNAANALKLI